MSIMEAYKARALSLFHRGSDFAQPYLEQVPYAISPSIYPPPWWL